MPNFMTLLATTELGQLINAEMPHDVTVQGEWTLISCDFNGDVEVTHPKTRLNYCIVRGTLRHPTPEDCGKGSRFDGPVLATDATRTQAA